MFCRAADAVVGRLAEWAGRKTGVPPPLCVSFSLLGLLSPNRFLGHLHVDGSQCCFIGLRWRRDTSRLH